MNIITAKAPDTAAFWAACGVEDSVRVRIVALTEEIAAMTTEAKAAAWDEINQWFIARMPGSQRTVN